MACNSQENSGSIPRMFLSALGMMLSAFVEYRANAMTNIAHRKVHKTRKSIVVVQGSHLKLEPSVTVL